MTRRNDPVPASTRNRRIEIDMTTPGGRQALQDALSATKRTRVSKHPCADAPAGQQPAPRGTAASARTIAVAALPPTVNHMYVTTRGGGKCLSAEALAFRDLVWTTSLARPADWRLPDGPLAFELRLSFDSKRRQDLDNRIKAALDALALALDFDDRRVQRIVVETDGNTSGPAECVMTIGALLSDPFGPESCGCHLRAGAICPACAAAQQAVIAAGPVLDVPKEEKRRQRKGTKTA